MSRRGARCSLRRRGSVRGRRGRGDRRWLRQERRPRLRRAAASPRRRLRAARAGRRSTRASRRARWRCGGCRSGSSRPGRCGRRPKRSVWPRRRRCRPAPTCSPRSCGRRARRPRRVPASVSGRRPVEIAVSGAEALLVGGADPVGRAVDVVVTTEPAGSAAGHTYVAAAAVPLLALAPGRRRSGRDRRRDPRPDPAAGAAPDRRRELRPPGDDPAWGLRWAPGSGTSPTLAGGAAGPAGRAPPRRGGSGRERRRRPRRRRSRARRRAGGAARPTPTARRSPPGSSATASGSARSRCCSPTPRSRR